MTRFATSRYGDPRTMTHNGHNLYTVEGKAHYYRVGMNEANTEIAYFDPEGGPMIAVGDKIAYGTIVSIIKETAPEGRFKIRLEVE
jgi:hypothetical protein